MANHAAPVPIGTTDPPPLIVDLDALATGTQLVPWRPQVVDNDVIVTHPSPLDPDEHGDYPTALRGGIVTDPDEIRAIRRRVEAHAESRGAWRRVLRRIRRGR